MYTVLKLTGMAGHFRKIMAYLLQIGRSSFPVLTNGMYPKIFLDDAIPFYAVC